MQLYFGENKQRFLDRHKALLISQRSRHHRQSIPSVVVMVTLMIEFVIFDRDTDVHDTKNSLDKRKMQIWFYVYSSVSAI